MSAAWTLVGQSDRGRAIRLSWGGRARRPRVRGPGGRTFDSLADAEAWAIDERGVSAWVCELAVHAWPQAHRLPIRFSHDAPTDDALDAAIERLEAGEELDEIALRSAATDHPLPRHVAIACLLGHRPDASCLQRLRTPSQ